MAKMAGFDVVIPDGNEEKFIEVALALSYTELVFLSGKPNYSYQSRNPTIRIRTAYLARDPSEINHAKKRFDLVFAPAERRYFESKADYIYNIERSDRRDSFHYKSTFLNQVHAVLAKGRGSCMVFNFSSLLDAKSFSELLIVLGRMMQNAVLIRKYRLKHDSFSLAKEPHEMRSKEVLSSLIRVVGL